MKPMYLLFVLPLLSCDGQPRTAPAGLPLGEYPIKPVPVERFDFEPDVVLLLTGGTNGRLEVCNCGGVSPGGLARRGGLLASYRASFGHTLTLDAGDTFWIEPDRVRHSHLLRGLKLLEYDALVLGAAEWATPPGELRPLLDGASLNYLSTNVTVRGATLPTVQEVRAEAGQAKIAVLSYAGEQAFQFTPKEIAASLNRQGAAAMQSRIDALRGEGCQVVLVVHDTADTANRLAQELRGLDAIIRGHTNKTERQASDVAGTAVVQVGGAETVGILALKFADGKPARHAWRVEVLDERWPADQRLLDLYQAYTHAAMREALDKDRKAGLAYHSSADCGLCHSEEYDFWRKTAHAHAYQTLQAVKRDGDPDCVICHVSGFGTEKGFYTAQKTPALANVNCQDCHRFDIDEHINGGRRRAEFAPPPAGEAVCLSCHTQINSPRFEYAAYRKKILGNGHGR